MLCVNVTSVSGKMAEWSKAPALGVAENREIDLQYYRIRWSERAWVRTPLFSSLRFFWCTRFVDAIDIDRDIGLFVFGCQYALKSCVEVVTPSVVSTWTRHYANKAFCVECTQGAVPLTIVYRVIMLSILQCSRLLGSYSTTFTHFPPPIDFH
jgi:hypothetical protein